MFPDWSTPPTSAHDEPLVGAYGAGQGAGQGLHDFTYSMYPHGGGWREAGTERAGCLPIASTMRPQDSLK